MQKNAKQARISLPFVGMSILLASSLAIIFWWSPFSALHNAYADTAYSSPITITDSNYGSGTFTGNWQSIDPNTPVIMIQTSKPITIRDSHLRGPGNLIDTTNTNSHSVTVINTYGYSTNPNVAGVAKGFFRYCQLVRRNAVYC